MFFRKKITKGEPFPLGATCRGDGCNFAIYSKNAQKVELCIFKFGKEYRINIPYKTDDVWHIHLSKVKAGTKYGFRVYGEFNPQKGMRFDGKKLLLDPYAKAITKPIISHPSFFKFSVNSARYMPKCLVVDINPIKKSTAPHIPNEKTIIYEAHLKGLTFKHPKINKVDIGTFSALQNKYIIKHLKELGITTLELMPTAAFFNEDFLIQKNLTNYWGYSPICFMAPHPTYLSGFDLKEIQDTIQTLHNENIEVIFDVVFNHSGEGNHNGPTLSLRGIDNTTYYKLTKNKQYYMDDTGCGNTLDLSSPVMRNLALDTLRYWVNYFDVDGFRFDLGLTLGRDKNNQYKKNNLFFKTLKTDPILKDKKFFTEPWDLGPDGYQLGNFPNHIHQWNGVFRDTVRRFFKSDEMVAFEMSNQFVYGDFDGCKKINFITAHDGFTLWDLVSYNQKNNLLNGENNRDGENNNFSWNSGKEGMIKDADIMDLRFKRCRAMMTSLLLSSGIPMIRMGDEFLKTGFGNNNSYCQDNEISWLNWHRISNRGHQMKLFIKEIISYRKEHPIFGEKLFPLSPLPQTNSYAGLLQNNQFVFLKSDGYPMQDFPAFAKSIAVLIKSDIEQSHFLILMNGDSNPVQYTLPTVDHSSNPYLLSVDSSGVVDILAAPAQSQFTLPAWSVVVFQKFENQTN